MSDLHPSEVEVVVSVASGEEDTLLGETLNELVQTLEAAAAADAGLMIIKSEYRGDALVKRLIFETAAPAARFRSMWSAAQTRLAHS